MAINLDLVGSSPHTQQWLATHDGAGGNTVALGSFLMASAVIPGGQLKELLTNPGSFIGAAASQSRSRFQMLGWNPGGIGIVNSDLARLLHCRVIIKPVSGVLVWVVDADVDGGSAEQHELNISTDAASAAMALIEVQLASTRAL